MSLLGNILMIAGLAAFNIAAFRFAITSGLIVLGIQLVLLGLGFMAFAEKAKK